MMKKITLLLMAFAFMIQTSFGQQVVFEETFGAAIPATWVNLDEDGVAPDEFFAGNSLFQPTAWETINFGFGGVAAYSLAEFDSTSTPATADDWLISPQVTLLTNPSLEVDFISADVGMTFEVSIATTLAGATPVPSDFTMLQSFSLAGNSLWSTEAIDLAAYSGQMVYLAVRNFTLDPMQDNQVKIGGVRNFRVLEAQSDDLELNEISFDERKNPLDGFIVDYASFCNATLANISITVTNRGLNPVTTFDATFDNISTTATETFTIPALATGQSTTVTFVAQANVDTFDAYFIDAWVSMAGDVVQSNDSSAGFENFTLMVTPKPDTVTIAEPFFTGFEFYDGANLGNFNNAFWTFQNPDGNANEFSVADNTASNSVSEGSYSLFLLGNANSANNDWAFSPCMYFESTKAYVISLKASVGSFTSGAPVPATLAMHLTSDDNAGSSVANLGDIVADDNVNFTEYFLSFSPSVSGIYNIGINQASALDWHVWIDEFAVNELPAPVAPIGNSSWDPCTSTATLTFAYDPINTYSVDWGDGSAVETVTSGSPTHVYAPSATPYTATITVANAAGNDNNPTTVNAPLLPAPDATFSYVQAGVTDASVDFTAMQDLSCYNYDYNYGDNTVHGTTPNSSHTYTASGTYTVTLFIQDPNSGDNDSKTQEVIVDLNVGINDIDFVGGINVFPNPVNDVLNINFDLNSVQTIEISLHSIDGKVVNSSTEVASNVNKVINTSKLSAGIYILDVTTKSGKYTTNVVVK